MEAKRRAAEPLNPPSPAPWRKNANIKGEEPWQVGTRAPSAQEPATDVIEQRVGNEAKLWGHAAVGGPRSKFNQMEQTIASFCTAADARTELLADKLSYITLKLSKHEGENV